jgi:hypothetical protein
MTTVALSRRPRGRLERPTRIDHHLLGFSWCGATGVKMSAIIRAAEPCPERT